MEAPRHANEHGWSKHRPAGPLSDESDVDTAWTAVVPRPGGTVLVR
ncbi:MULTISPECIES: hypothetical protein [unclassified Streptomyces]|nr:hypothetical protein [Streptomyces sp. JV184]MEE1742916.1 hypothetical protein [Streptomyces sp. JV184]